ncbi:uncharacterized protein LOC135139155 [Zophobas morio]|uniref:uncharacterized protein LOC135139155 n=1 Tax=Zophobas morio TaxID=2755281 RepID=UPI00308361CC
MAVLKERKFALTLFTLSSLITSFDVLAIEEDEIIRFVNKTHIYCVHPEDFQLAMFTNPPLEGIQYGKKLLDIENWENDDWKINDLSNIISVVTDKRWEEFPVLNTNYKYFPNFNPSVTFSIYRGEDIQLYVDDEESLDYLEPSPKNREEWTTFTIFFKDNYVNYFMNNDRIRTHNLKPTNLAVKTKNQAYFKIHSGKYKEATNVTNTTNGPTTLRIPHVNNPSFIILYISLCRSCVLEVEYGGHRENITSNTTETSDFEEWQTHKINLTSSATNEVNFIRKNNNQTEHGYWRLDARLYEYGHNVVAYKITPDISPEAISCNYLLPDTTESNRMKRGIKPTESSRQLVNCPLGMVGAKCDISCASILGDQYSECQKHKICDVQGCQCHPYYKGSWCDEKVATGDERQGSHNDKSASIISKDNENLKKYEKNDSTSSWMFWSNILLWVLLLCLILFLIFERIIIKRNKISQPVDDKPLIKKSKQSDHFFQCCGRKVEANRFLNSTPHLEGRQFGLKI